MKIELQIALYCFAKDISEDQFFDRKVIFQQATLAEYYSGIEWNQIHELLGRIHKLGGIAELHVVDQQKAFLQLAKPISDQGKALIVRSFWFMSDHYKEANEENIGEISENEKAAYIECMATFIHELNELKQSKN